MASESSGLVDQFNTPIARADIAALKSQVGAPSSFSARPPFVGHIAFGINPSQLGMIIRAADNGQTREWMILAEEIEELFTHYSAVLGKRRRQVCLLPITVEAADTKKVAEAEKHADFVREFLETKVLQRALFDTTDAMGKGYSVNEIMWESAPGCVRPAEILWRNPRDFEVSWEDGQTIWLRNEAGFTPLTPHKFLLHTHGSKSGGAVRSGLTRMVAWLWMYSTFTLKDWALFVQGYGLPVRLGRYGPEASDQDKQTLWRAVRGIAGDLAATIPKSMEMEFVQPGQLAGAADLFMGRASWLNYEVSKLVLGGSAGTDAIKGGHAVGQEHRAAEQDVEKFDAGLLEASIDRQILQAMVAFTFGPQAAYPTLRIGTEEQVPLSDVIAAVADLGPLNFKVRASEIYDRLQLTAPEGEEDTLIGMPPAGTDAAGNPLVKADLTPKANPHPEINPASDARALLTARRQARAARNGKLFGRLAAMTGPSEAVVDALETRLAREAGAALAAMTAQIRDCFEAADDLPDLAARLKGLNLDDKAFATAMMQGMTLANLAGQAELLDELAPGT